MSPHDRNDNKVALAIVKNVKGKVLIIKRARLEHAWDNKDLTWAFPGGVLDGSETLEDAAVREVKDETGYTIKVIKKISQRENPVSGTHLNYYECELADFKVKPIQEVDEIETLKWVEPSELLNYFTTSLDPGVAKFLGL